MAGKKYSKRIWSSGMFLIGFLLSPLSWWNDIFINLPLAYLMAVPFGIIHHNFFIPVMVFSYWCTNLLGFIMMHYGSKKILEKDKKNENFKKELFKMLVISALYTLLITLLVIWGILKFPTDYFKK